MCCEKRLKKKKKGEVKDRKDRLCLCAEQNDHRTKPIMQYKS